MTRVHGRRSQEKSGDQVPLTPHALMPQRPSVFVGDFRSYKILSPKWGTSVIYLAMHGRDP
jgi:hypothetical protein